MSKAADLLAAIDSGALGLHHLDRDEMDTLRSALVAYSESTASTNNGWCITRTLYWRGTTQPDKSQPHQGLWSEHPVSCLRLGSKESAEQHAKEQGVPQPHRIAQWSDEK